MVWKSTQAFYEGIDRIPLIVSYPRRITPGRSARPVRQVDLLPTLL
jgi:arylsulfatase A-like enzyme